MFVSHFSSFLFYLYVFASVQRKNHLAWDKRFLTIPTMPWFNRKKWFVLRQATKHHHNHGRRPLKCPQNAPLKALRLVLTRQIDGQQPPKQADIILGVLRGCMALNVLLCFGNDASPWHWSVLRAVHPLNPLKIISICSGDRCSSIKDNGAGRRALFVAQGGDFCRRRMWSAIVVMFIVDRWRQIIWIPTQHSYILDADHQKLILPI